MDSKDSPGMEPGKQLRAAFGGGAALARRLGLPVDAAANLFEQRLAPQLIPLVAPRVIGALRHSGLRITAYHRGYIEACMPMRGNRNHAGTMYAGALFMLAEAPAPMLFATAMLRQGLLPIVRSLDLRFLNPARSDVHVTFDLRERIDALEREALRLGKLDFELQSELRDAQGVVVATATAGYQLRTRGLR